MLTLHAPPLFNGSLMQLAKCPFHTGHFCIIPGAPKINIENDSSGFWKAGWSLCFLPTYTRLLIYQISAGRGGACKANKTRDTQKTQQAGANSDQTAASAVQSWMSRRGWMGGCLTVSLRVAWWMCLGCQSRYLFCPPALQPCDANWWVFESKSCCTITNILLICHFSFVLRSFSRFWKCWHLFSTPSTKKVSHF